MKPSELKVAIAGSIMILIGFPLTIRNAPAQERFDMKVRVDFFAGFAGNGEALARGMKACEEELARNPKSAQALVWHGGGLLFHAGAAFRGDDQAKGIDLWTSGLKEMQTAVDMEPDSVPVRIARGAVLLTSSRYVPATMAKPLIVDGVADYRRTYELQAPSFAMLDVHSRGELLFGIAEGYSRLGDGDKARAYFEQIRKDLPGTPYAKRADLWMEKGSIPADQTRCVGCHTGK